MKKLCYVLILLFLFTSYLFSQTEESKTIKVDTIVIIKVDTVTVTNIDTIVIAEPINKQYEQTDLKRYYFYNDYY